jgi:hypothetical protein
MTERSRKPYIPPAIRDRGEITEQTLQSIHCLQESTDPEQPAPERAAHSRSRSEPEER